MNTTDNQQPNVLTFESPASWNTRYITPDGFECQLTLRGESGQELLERVQAAISYLLKSGCKPCTNGKYSSHIAADNSNHASTQEETNKADTHDNGIGNGTDQSWCPIHNVAMKRWEKNGRVWFSHKVGDQWCTGKVKTR